MYVLLFAFVGVLTHPKVFLTAKLKLLRPPSNDKPAETDSATDAENFH